MASVDPELMVWAGETLDLGLGCLNDGDHNPFILVVEESGRRQLIDLKNADGTISASLLEGGRDIIRQFGAGHYYALVWDGYLTKDGERRDAVFAEAGAGGESQALIFAQQYEQVESGELAKLGKPLVAAEAAPLWGKNITGAN